MSGALWGGCCPFASFSYLCRQLCVISDRKSALGLARSLVQRLPSRLCILRLAHS